MEPERDTPRNKTKTPSNALVILTLVLTVSLFIATCLVFVMSNTLASIYLQCLRVFSHSNQSATSERPAPLWKHSNYNLLYQYPECGKRKPRYRLQFRVYEGRRARTGQLPWMVLLGQKEGDSEMWFCAGTLITRRYVLTAAHCVANVTKLAVKLGSHDAEEEYHEMKVVEVERVLAHPLWNVRGTLKHDIALVRLIKDIDFGSTIVPICLPLSEDDLLPEENPTYEVAGWGAEEITDPPSLNSRLLRAKITGKPISECNICTDNRSVFCPITDTQICGQGYKGVDVCKGDSGGPLVKYEGPLHIPYQVGITSFNTGQDCGQQDFPSIFTNVSAYGRWILDNLEESKTLRWTSILHYFPLFTPRCSR